MTPQVLVVDGRIVINEKSLTVNAAVERATALSDFTRVEESGTKLNSATYANYAKAEKWTKEDTEFFFQALRQFGTDFSLIQRLFPGRSRRQIKKKYLMEDKMNPTRVEEAIRNLNPDVALYENLIRVLKTEGAGQTEDPPGVSVAKAVLTKNDEAENSFPPASAPALAEDTDPGAKDAALSKGKEHAARRNQPPTNPSAPRTSSRRK